MKRNDPDVKRHFFCLQAGPCESERLERLRENIRRREYEKEEKTSTERGREAEKQRESERSRKRERERGREGEGGVSLQWSDHVSV